MDSSAEWLAESGVTVGLCRLERHSSTSACGSQDTSQGWFADPSSYSEEEADFLNEVLLHQDALADAPGRFSPVGDRSMLQGAMSGVSTTSSDIECDCVAPSIGSSTNTVSILQMPTNNPPLKLQLDYGDVMRTWEQLVGQKRSVGSPSNPVQSAHDEFSAIRSAQYQLPSAPACTASYPRNYTPSSFAPSCLPTAMSGDSMVQCSMPFGYLHSARSDNIADRCMSLPAAPVQAWSNQALGGQQLQERSVSLERYRVQKATRPSVGPAVRNQLCKVKAEKPRFQGAYATPSKLAELQLDAALSTEYGSSSSPMLSGGSSTSIFL